MATGDAIAHLRFGGRDDASDVRAAPQSSTLGWRLSLISWALRLVDCAVLVLAAVLVFEAYVDQAPEPAAQQVYILVAFAAVVQLNIFNYWGFYTLRKLTSLEYQFRTVILATLVLLFIVISMLYITETSSFYSPTWMLLWFAAAAGGLLAIRATVYPVVRRLLRRGSVVPRVAVVGSGLVAERLVNYLRSFEDAPVDVVGMFDDRAAATGRSSVRLRPNGTVDQLCQLARTSDMDGIILALPDISEAQRGSILEKLRSLPVDIRLCKDTLEFCQPQQPCEFYGVVPLLRLYDKPISRWGVVAKFIEDRVLATCLLFLLAPLMLAIAALIKLDSSGPVFFKQRRYGFNNRLITVWKFRTMYHHQADANAERLATKDDPRVTRVGRFLRSTSLDELPNLINVLRGDMSLVGPRPHAIAAKAGGELYESVVKEYAARHRVKPGITGWAQVNGWRGETDTKEKILKRVEHDLVYIDNWSIWFDLKILFMTFGIVFGRENAY